MKQFIHAFADARMGRETIVKRRAMRTSLNSRGVAVVIVLSFGVAGRCDESVLLAALKSRVNAVESFQADVDYVKSSGRDRAALAKAYIDRNEWYAVNMPELHNLTTPESAAVLAKGHPTKTRRLKYYWRAPYELRIEHFSHPVREDAPPLTEPIVIIFTGERWERLIPRSVTEAFLNELTIHAKQLQDGLWLEIARGGGVFQKRYLGAMSGKNVYKSLDHIQWRDVLPQIATDGVRETSEALPTGGPPKPVLQLSLGYLARIKKPLVRAKVWFEPSQNYLPLRLEMRVYVESTLPEDRYEALTVADWSDPVRLPGGHWIARKCTIHTFDDFANPIKGVPSSDWPITRYETEVYNYTFSNVVVNQPFDDSLFAMKPPPSTNVVDTVSGQHVIVGSAGEEIRRAALNAREEFPLRTERWWERRIWRVVIGLAIVLATGSAIFWQWRKTARSRAP
jgi:hypothetical protein